MNHLGNHAGFSARFIGAVAAAALAWYLVVRPTHVSLVQARAELATSLDEIASYDRAFAQDPTNVPKLIESMSESQKLVEQRSLQTSDAARIYEALGTIAGEANVRIERIEPNKSAARDKKNTTPKGVTVESVAYTIDLTGSYSAIASFFSKIESDLGFSKIASARISSAQLASDPTILSASVETVHGHLVRHEVSESAVDSKAGAKSGSKAVTKPGTKPAAKTAAKPASKEAKR